MFCTFSLQNVLLATAACNFSTSEFQKVLRTPRVLCIFTSKCASRHSGLQFFDIRTSKSAPKLTCFVRFHFEMRFSPQRRAIFPHQNFQKCEHEVFCTLQNVLFATAACNFWFLLWAPTSAPAALTGLLFDWPDTRIIEKTQHFATSLTFGADVSSFFWLSHYCISFLLTWLLYSAFQLSILSEVCYLNFLRLYIHYFTSYHVILCTMCCYGMISFSIISHYLIIYHIILLCYKHDFVEITLYCTVLHYIALCYFLLHYLFTVCSSFSIHYLISRHIALHYIIQHTVCDILSNHIVLRQIRLHHILRRTIWIYLFIYI